MDLPAVRVLITGGIGSGKSTVSSVLARHGFEVIDADRLGHRVLEPDGLAFKEVAERWPEVVVGEQLDRQRLASIVFAEPEELAALEATTHPRIQELLNQELSKVDEVVIEMSVPKLIDRMEWTVVVVVDAPSDLRLRRLLARGMHAQDSLSRMAVQPSRNQWLKLADVVLDNSGDQSWLFEASDRLARWLGGSTNSQPPVTSKRAELPSTEGETPDPSRGP